MALQGTDLFVVQRGPTVYSMRGSDILAYVQSNVGTSEYHVADIAARNALTNLSMGDRAFVVDATADATVSSGWAIYAWLGASWSKVAEQEMLDITAGGADLSYSSSAVEGVVNSSTGTDATIPAATGSIAGLMLPGQFTKLSNITVTAATDLDAIRNASHAAVTLGGTTNTNPLTISGQQLNFSISNLTLAP